MKMLGVQREDSQKNLDVADAINAWRAALRETGYVDGTNMCHIAIDGKPLHPELVNFIDHAIFRRLCYINEIVLGKPSQKHKFSQPVFITNEEELKYSKS